MKDILLEMDRVLRPEGSVVFRDDVDYLVKIKSIIDGMQWESRIVDHENGPHQPLAKIKEEAKVLLHKAKVLS